MKMIRDDSAKPVNGHLYCEKCGATLELYVSEGPISYDLERRTPTYKAHYKCPHKKWFNLHTDLRGVIKGDHFTANWLVDY